MTNENIMLMPIGGANAPIDVAPEPLRLDQANVDHAIAELIQTQEQNKDNPSEKNWTIIECWPKCKITTGSQTCC